MSLGEYFDSKKGTGVLATTDDKGQVDAAVYARPHMLEDGNLAFIMPDRLTHSNLQSNPHAAYLFIEEGGGYKGKRLFLTKVREEQDSELIETLRRKSYPNEEGSRYLVVFKVDKELPLVGLRIPLSGSFDIGYCRTAAEPDKGILSVPDRKILNHPPVGSAAQGQSHQRFCLPPHLASPLT